VKIRKPVLIVLGEPNSIFIEILSKVLNKKKIKKKINFPIIIIGSSKLIYSQLKKLNKKLFLNILDTKNLRHTKISNKIYLIDVKYNFKKPFEKISKNSKNYISKCFDIGLKIINSKLSDIIINGPISKKHFLENKYPGITEYIFNKSKRRISKNPVMLIYNKKLSVSPITTHIPLKYVHRKINQKKIINNILNVNNFYIKNLSLKPKIAILGLNPHCESNSKYNEELKIIIPAIKNLKKRQIDIHGPFAADTFFLKENFSKYNSVIGMYHDQVLTPIKTLFKFDASNITLGLPFLRLSVDHGPNETMIGKNKSNTKSLENIFNFIHNIK